MFLMVLSIFFVNEVLQSRRRKTAIFCKRRQLIPDVSLEWMFLFLCDAFRDKSDIFVFVFLLIHPEREVR